MLSDVSKIVAFTAIKPSHTYLHTVLVVVATILIIKKMRWQELEINDLKSKQNANDLYTV